MVFALLVLLAGLAVMLLAGAGHRRERQRAMEDLLGMKPRSPDHEADEELSAVTGRAVDLAGQVVDRLDRGHSLGQVLARAKIGLRPGEFVIVVAGGALGIAALLMVVTQSTLAAAGGALAGVVVAVQFVKRRVTKRRRAFEAQLPDALSLVASSLSAGHTFLRAIQMMCQESGPPMSEEFDRVVADTCLGDGVVEALERMSVRLQVREMDMVVQAIRIQQTVGGRLADLLHTLADVIRARDEVRREVQVLTAEGRMSAYVLAGLVPFLFIVIQVLNPRYVEPLYQGWGLVLLVGCGASVVIGMLVILRMVKIEA